MRIYYTIPIVRRHGQDKSENGLCLLKNGDPHYLVLQATSITKFYLTVYYFQHSLAQMSFIYCHLNFHANLLRPWPFPLRHGLPSDVYESKCCRSSWPFLQFHRCDLFILLQKNPDLLYLAIAILVYQYCAQYWYKNLLQYCEFFPKFCTILVYQ